MKRRDVIGGAALIMVSARFAAGDAQAKLKTLVVFSPGDLGSTLSAALQALVPTFLSE